jgi:FkbM family methyltransferase
MKIRRNDFLISVASATAGAALGVLGHRQFTQASQSFAQSGEDLIVAFIFNYLKIPGISYLDVGAWHPIEVNNTYLFYKMGWRGVLVEPNVTMCEELRAVRPEDTTLAAGIGVTAVREADYYIMTEPAWSTFSKEEAEHQTKVTAGRISIRKVVKMPLLDINDVMNKHFEEGPDFLSIDAEGLHLAILKSIDFERFRPKVICVETLVSGTNRTDPEVPAFLEAEDYVVRGQTFPNTIFVDSWLL